MFPRASEISINREKRRSFAGALRTKIGSSWHESKIRSGEGGGKAEGKEAGDS